jgi:hypothetical protein
MMFTLVAMTGVNELQAKRGALNRERPFQAME